MSHTYSFLLVSAAVLGITLVAAGDDEVVFRSDVNMTRIDAQVVDRDNRAVTGLRIDDFTLFKDGKPIEIRSFAAEDMPIDLLLLLDVSGSMQAHVRRLSSAAHQALESFGKDDRVGIMVFDRATRLRLPLTSNKANVERELEALLRHETFNGGTDITRGLLDAAEYIGRSGRREARRAIVILTDDQTEFSRDDDRVGNALTRADAVLSALLAPNIMPSRGGRGGRAPSGGSWPGSGGPLGGVIWGGGGRQRGGVPGGGPMGGGSRTTSAGTADIARASGGDSMPVDDAYALETTLSRIRQRYALYFYLPEGANAGPRGVQVELADAVSRRFPSAEVRYRRVNLANNGSGNSTPEPTSVTRAPISRPSTASRSTAEGEVVRRRPRSDGSTGPRSGPLNVGQDDDTPSAPAAKPSTRLTDDTQTPSPQDSGQGGWRQLKPGEKP